MVFVGGPRQVGKTQLGKMIIRDPAAHLNFDIAEHRNAILKGELPATKAWFFDEIHKYRAWRNELKALYDAAGRRKRILVTGSARLDLYRFGGDSLQGRYFYFRLHPLSLAEVGGKTSGDLASLLELSGFPEPFLGGSATEARRWSLAYRERLVRDEVTSLESISDLAKLELLAISLPSRVGSPLSVNALREDLHVSHATVARWLDVLERLYAIFRVPPSAHRGCARSRRSRSTTTSTGQWSTILPHGSRTSWHPICSNGPTIKWTRRAMRSSCDTTVISTGGRSTSSSSTAGALLGS